MKRSCLLFSLIFALSFTRAYCQQANGTINNQTTVALGSSVVRSAQDKLREDVSVLDFGADPTGVANSTPAFQNAVNAIGSGNSGIVYCPPGTYLLNTSVTAAGPHPLFWLGPGCTLTGSGSLSVTAMSFGTSLFSVQTPIRMASVVAASLPSASPAGQVLYVSNGAPGSNPCTGGGTGATAFSTGSAWNCASQLPAGNQTQYLQLEPNAGNSITARFASLPTLNTTDYNFPAQAPGGSLSTGSNTVTVSPVPIGMNATDPGHYVEISSGTGTAEPCLITGGNAVSGSASGQIVIQCANNHSGAWTVQSATAGIGECLASSGSAVNCQMPAGTLTVHGPAYVPSGYAVSGQGIWVTTLSVASDFLLTAPSGATQPGANVGVFIAPYTGSQIASGESFASFGVSFTQPDSTNLSLYTHWPAAFNMEDVGRLHIKDVVVEAAWDGVLLEGAYTGGAILEDLQMSCFDKCIYIDGPQDSTYLTRVRFWPYGLTTNQTTVFTTNAAVYGLYAARVDDIEVNQLFADAANGIYFFNSVSGSPEGNLSNIQLDTTSSMTITGSAALRISNVIQSFQPGQYNALSIVGNGESNGSFSTVVQISNWNWFPATGTCFSTDPLVSVTGTYASVQITNSQFFASACDLPYVAATGSGHEVILTNSWWARDPNATHTYTYPMVSMGSSAGRLTFVGNKALDAGSSTGALVSIATDDYHQVRANSAPGWSYVFPTKSSAASSGVYEAATTLDMPVFSFANLPGTVPQPGGYVYCNNCTTAATCAGSGTGHIAVSNGSIWTCQ